MADPEVDAGDLNAAADLIEAFDDEAVIRLLDDPEILAEPAEQVVAPVAEVTMEEFRAYANANGVRTGKDFTDLTQRNLTDLTPGEAKRLLAEVLDSMPHSDGDQI